VNKQTSRYSAGVDFTASINNRISFFLDNKVVVNSVERLLFFVLFS